MLKIIQLSLLALITTGTHLMGYTEWNDPTITQYPIESVLQFIDFKQPTSHVYLIGEDHPRSTDYHNDLRAKARSDILFFITETAETINEVNVWTIENQYLWILFRFIEYHYFLYAFNNALNDYNSIFASWFPEYYQLEFESQFAKYAGFIPSEYFEYELQQLWAFYHQKLRYDPYFKTEVETKTTNLFYVSLKRNSSTVPNLNGAIYNNELHEAVFNAALYCLETVQHIHPNLLKKDYDTISQWLHSMHPTHFSTHEINKLNNIYMYITNIVMIQKRNLFFASQFLEIYEKIHDKNRPIIFSMGQGHLEGVSALLKEHNIPHTCVDLLAMKTEEVIIQPASDSYEHDEL